MPAGTDGGSHESPCGGGENAALAPTDILADESAAAGAS